MKKSIKRIIVVSLIAGAIFFGFSAQADTENKGLEVNFRVPTATIVCGDGIQQGSEACDLGSGCQCNSNATLCCNNCQIVSSCGGGGDTTAPLIYDLASSTTQNTASVLWKAVDSQSPPVVCSFSYGAGLSSIPVKSGNDFSVNLESLIPGTAYDFTITCLDSFSNRAYKTGSFTTIPGALPALDILNWSVVLGINHLDFSWTTNRNATGQVNYGESLSYDSTAVSPFSGTDHTASAMNLKSCTLYYYRILALANGSEVSREGSTTTLFESTPPSDINLTISTSSEAIGLSWVKPSDLDFKKVKILRNGLEIYDGNGTELSESLPPLVCGSNYCYKATSYDACGNASGGTEKCAKVNCPSPNCGNGIIDTGEDCERTIPITTRCSSIDASYNAGSITCGTDCKFNVSGCRASCGDGVVESALGEECEAGVTFDKKCTDYDPKLTSGSVVCNKCKFDNTRCSSGGVITTFCGDGHVDAISGEQCDGGSENSDCPTDKVCSKSCKWNNCGKIEICGNGLDDDNNGLIDCADLACASDPGCKSQPPPYEPPTSTVPDFLRLRLEDVLFSVGNRLIKLLPQNGVITSLSNTHFTVGVRKQLLNGEPKSLLLVIDGQSHTFVYSETEKTYYADVSFPPVGNRRAFIEVDYGNDQTDNLAFGLNSLAKGTVIDSNNNRVPQTKIILYNDQGKMFLAGTYGQINPQITDINGLYGWVVPNGRYYLTVESSKYYSHKTQLFVVGNNVINRPLKVILKPVKPADVIPATVARVVEAVGETVDNPVVEQVASQIAAPASVAVVSVGTAALVSWFDLLAWLRFLFLQPILIFSRRKRAGWGQVYNSLTKLPIDLAIVRLIDARTNRVVQSKVTDRQGRYVFIVSPGEYKLEVVKNGFVFPSVFLQGFKNDGRRPDIYHGEIIKVTEKNASVTVNIPLDPKGETKSPSRLRWQKIAKHIQVVLARVGLLVTIISLYIAPVWYMWILLGVHLFLLLVFRRLGRTQKTKGWGIVYDADDKRPIGRVVARLFDAQFNKLISTEITDRHGRYSFLAGDSKFYVSYDRSDYDKTKTEVIDLTGKEEGTIAQDVGLKKIQNTLPPIK